MVMDLGRAKKVIKVLAAALNTLTAMSKRRPCRHAYEDLQASKYVKEGPACFAGLC